MNFPYPALWASLCMCLIACGPPSTSSSGEAATDASASARTASSTNKREGGTAGRITIAVDETFQPIMESEISTFMGKYPDAEINALYLPGEEAISAMLEEDSIRLVVASRELTRDEQAYLRQQKTSAKTSRLATDAVAMIVHKDNMDTVLSQQQITGILSGEITSWDEINPSSTLGEIRLVFDHPQSSTVQFLNDSILAPVGKRLREQQVYNAKTNKAVLRYVTQDQHALGILGIAWISDLDDKEMAIFRKDSIHVLKLESLEPCPLGGTTFQPYQAYINQRCYPYTRGIYAVLRESFFGLGSGFVSYMASDPGQRIILKSGLVPEMGVKRVVRLPSKRELEAQ